MEVVANTSRPIRFVPFELDVRSRELRKGMRVIRLQEQPFDVLWMLLERPGEVVTRPELQRRLWPDGTFVDFEHGLNAAVKRLRTALGDDAHDPRFIETLPRRGYRFIAKLDAVSEPAGRAARRPSEAFEASFLLEANVRSDGDRLLVIVRVVEPVDEHL